MLKHVSPMGKSMRKARPNTAFLCPYPAIREDFYGNYKIGEKLNEVRNKNDCKQMRLLIWTTKL